MAYGFHLSFSKDVTNVVQDVDANNPIRLGMIQAYNPNAAAVYLQFFAESASSVTLGTTVPTVSIGIGPGDTLSQNFSSGWKFPGSAFSTAITSTAVGNGAPVASVRLSLVYGGA